MLGAKFVIYTLDPKLEQATKTLFFHLSSKIFVLSDRQCEEADIVVLNL